MEAWAEDAGYASTEEMINDNLEVNKANKLQQFETLFTEQEREGKYEEKEGKLYLSNSTTEAVNEETDFYADYEIKDGQLTLKMNRKQKFILKITGNRKLLRREKGE